SDRRASRWGYRLSLHDGLPIWMATTGCPNEGVCSWTSAIPEADDGKERVGHVPDDGRAGAHQGRGPAAAAGQHQPAGGHGQEDRSEEHTSELQSRENIVCRRLL